MVYDKPFWSKNLGAIQVLWTPDENEENLFNRLDNFNEKNWYENICYIEAVNDQYNVLSVWISGCEFFETFSDKKIGQDCTNLLKKLLAKDDIPMPKSIIKSTWYSNKFFRGSYSFLPLGSDPSDLINIAEPITITQVNSIF